MAGLGCGALENNPLLLSQGAKQAVNLSGPDLTCIEVISPQTRPNSLLVLGKSPVQA